MRSCERRLQPAVDGNARYLLKMLEMARGALAYAGGTTYPPYRASKP